MSRRNSAPRVRIINDWASSVASIAGVPASRRAMRAMPASDPPLMSSASKLSETEASPSSRYTGADR